MIYIQSTPKLSSLLLQLWCHLKPRRRLQICLLLVVMLASSFGEVLSLATVLPFLAVLANPEGLFTQPFLHRFLPILGISSPDQLLLPITLIFSFSALFAGAIRLLNLWLNGQLAASIGSDISCDAFRRTLYQPYAVHLARNSSNLISSINTDVARVIGQVLNPILLTFSSSLIAISLICTLLAIDWIIALATGFLLAIIYSSSMLLNQAPLHALGSGQVVLNRRLIQILQEGLGAIRDVLLNGYQNFYVDSYSRTDRPLRMATANAAFLSSYPRLILEPVGIVLLALAGYILVRLQGIDRALPLLGAMAFGAQRLLPISQKVYEGWAQTRSAKASLSSLLELLNQPISQELTDHVPNPLSFQTSVEFLNVRFRYAPDQPEVLKGLTFKIHKGERIGIIGTTGSGKSTTLDILMGLLAPSSGQLLLDNVDLYNSCQHHLLSDWRANIAHVPQNVYLSDSSIAENIALGIPIEHINMNLVKYASQQAQISGFIENCPDSYNMFVGERGIRLSGGQRQRIGIARALYKEAQFLVFDEATSSLDTSTEQLLMNAIECLSRDLTIVMIAHRLSTLQHCDRIIRIENGCIAYNGPPI